MVNKYGMTNWDEANQERNNHSRDKNQKDSFLKLQNGPNIVRILTKPYQYVIHKGWKVNENDAGFGWKLQCSKFNGESCPLCEQGVKTQTRWYVGVIDRASQAFKILDIAYGIFKDIKNYNADEDWGNPETYDVNIKCDKNADPQSYYSVIPKAKKPLSQADLAIKTQVEERYAEEIASRCLPPTREQLEKRMDSIRNYVNGKAKGASKVSSNGASNSVADHDDGSEMDFPPN